MILLLVMENGAKQQFGIGDSMQNLIRAIHLHKVETIVAGDMSGSKVVWEKHFNACTVMPVEFGKRPTKGTK